MTDVAYEVVENGCYLQNVPETVARYFAPDSSQMPDSTQTPEPEVTTNPNVEPSSTPYLLSDEDE